MNSAAITIDPIIGMEIHVQLRTVTKLFCGCAVEFGAEPNSRVCPVCLGLPGALPVINRAALELAVRAGLAMGCTIADTTLWDRKSYYYPDLPKNYQISQYELPVAGPGRVTYSLDDGIHDIRIRRAHLEEDAGKNLHDQSGVTLVDFNRTGTPLLEIVTEPDLHSAEACSAFATELHQLLVYLGVSEGVMKMAHMRFEPNVNVRIVSDDREYTTPICEIKNLNSFKSIRSAVAFEIDRQVTTWQQDPDYTLSSRGHENRGWDDNRQETVFQRTKELAHDYRYFPDPDLVPVVIDQKWLNGLRQSLPELPLARRQRLIQEHRLSPADASQIVEDRAGADLFDGAIDCQAPAGILSKHFISFWAKLANERHTTVAGLGVSTLRLAALAQLQQNGQINATAAAQIARHMVESDAFPEQIAAEQGLQQIQDVGVVEALVDEVIAEHAEAVALVESRGKKWEKSLGYLLGQVMQKSKGSAAPQVVREILERRFGLKES